MRYYLTIYLSGMLVMAAMDEIDLLGASFQTLLCFFSTKISTPINSTFDFHQPKKWLATYRLRPDVLLSSVQFSLPTTICSFVLYPSAQTPTMITNLPPGGSQVFLPAPYLARTSARLLYEAVKSAICRPGCKLQSHGIISLKAKTVKYSLSILCPPVWPAMS